MDCQILETRKKAFGLNNLFIDFCSSILNKNEIEKIVLAEIFPCC